LQPLTKLAYFQSQANPGVIYGGIIDTGTDRSAGTSVIPVSIILQYLILKKY